MPAMTAAQPSADTHEPAGGESISLDGVWRFRLANGAWQDGWAPAAWETFAADRSCDGPAEYRRSVRIPPRWLLGGRTFLESDGISFRATLSVNGRRAASHEGAWSRVQIDISRFLRHGDNDLALTVWRPGARFSPRASLAGFLPDLGAAFGGLWRPIRLVHVDGPTITRLRIGTLGETARAQGLCAGGATARLTVIGAASGIGHAPVGADGVFAVEAICPGASRWQPGNPSLAAARVDVFGPDGRPVAGASRRIGFRDLALTASAARIDGAPLHVRGVLDWGWDPVRRAPDPPASEVRARVRLARSFGFNLIKLCLHAPGDAVFDVADELGMLLWLELPLWQPRMSGPLRALALREADAILARVHHHPSLAVLSLGCELDRQVDAGFLARLNAVADAWLPGVPRVTNSGSAEAFGGAPARADFHDYHFYADPHFLGGLLRHFDPPGRPPRAWLLGEFCDADTFRVFPPDGDAPDWLTDPLPNDPTPELAWTRDYAARLAAAGVTDRGRALTALGRRQAMAVRKHALEETRKRLPGGGYVVTGWRDTPITTSGIVDDEGRPKFDPVDWRRFNADRVLLLDRGPARRWVAGGDRPAVADPYCIWADERAPFRVLLANGGAALTGLSGVVTFSAGGWRTRGGASLREVAADATSEVIALEVRSSHEVGPTALSIRARVTWSQGALSNRWSGWVIPDRPGTLARISDAGDRLAAEWSPELPRRARSGERITLWLRDPAAPGQIALPFWREAIHVLGRHRLWRRLPGLSGVDLRFYSLAADRGLDPAFWRARLPRDAEITPIWRRFDARRMTWADYAIEARIGRGALVVTTLRFAGGLGDQPAGLESVPLGAWMLADLLRGP